MDKIVRKDIRKSKGEKKGRKVLEKRLEEKEKHRKVRPGKIGGPCWATRWMESPSASRWMESPSASTRHFAKLRRLRYSSNKCKKVYTCVCHTLYGCFCRRYMGKKFSFHLLVSAAHKILGSFFWFQATTAIYGSGENEIFQSCFLMFGACNMDPDLVCCLRLAPALHSTCLC